MSIHRTAFVLPLIVLAGCLPEATLDTEVQQASYAIGYDMGRSLAEVSDHVDMVALVKGMSDAMGGADPALEEQDIEHAMEAFNEIVQAARGEAAAGALSAGQAFLAENAAADGVMVTESGLQYIVLREGDGASPMPGQFVTLHYRGTLPDGTEFDSSYDGEPVTFGVDQVIAGFGEAVTLMQVGGHLRAFLPAALGYGAGGSPPEHRTEPGAHLRDRTVGDRVARPASRYSASPATMSATATSASAGRSRAMNTSVQKVSPR